MSSHNAVVGTVKLEEVQVIAPDHPTVARSGLVKQGQGKLQPGQLLGLDGDSLLVAYVTGGTNLKGVNKHLVDTDQEAAAVYVAHGTVNMSALTVGGSSPAAADIAKLEALTIYPV